MSDLRLVDKKNSTVLRLVFCKKNPSNICLYIEFQDSSLIAKQVRQKKDPNPPPPPALPAPLPQHQGKFVPLDKPVTLQQSAKARGGVRPPPPPPNGAIPPPPSNGNVIPFLKQQDKVFDE